MTASTYVISRTSVHFQPMPWYTAFAQSPPITRVSPSRSQAAAMPRSKRDAVRSRTASAPSPESPLLGKRKVFAQRKFAQGVTTPYTGSAPPSPPAASSRAASPAPLPPDGPLPKTEDFITFLCFRGALRDGRAVVRSG